MGGHSEADALTAAKIITGLCANAKGKALGIYRTPPSKKPAAKTADTEPSDSVSIGGRVIRLPKGPSRPDPAKIEAYLRSAFKEHLVDVQTAMKKTSRSYGKEELRANAMRLYERFRPAWKGWGVTSELHLSDIAAAKK